MWILVERGREGAKIQVLCGRHVWMAPKGKLERRPAFQEGPRSPTGLIRHCRQSAYNLLVKQLFSEGVPIDLHIK